MGSHRWFNASQPQTMQSAVILLYITAVFALIYGLTGVPIDLFPVLGAAGAYGIANEKKWGYYLACGVAVFPVALLALAIATGSDVRVDTNSLVRWMFDALLIVLLFHPMTRQYFKIWFK